MTKYFVVAIYDAHHGKQELYQIEVRAKDPDKALKKAFKRTVLPEKGITYEYFISKCGKRFVINTIEI